jgi:cytochrome c
MFTWLADPQKMFADSSMMSLGVPDAQQRADLIAFLQAVTVREINVDGTTEAKQ